MVGEELTRRFEDWAERGRPPLHDDPALATAALMAHAAFVEPERQVAIFDAIAAAPPLAQAEARAAHLEAALPFLTEAVPSRALRRVPRPLWDAFWAIVRQPPMQGVDPLAFTTSVVAIGIHYDQELIDRCEAAVLQFEGVRRLIETPEVRMRTSDLEGYPEGTLGTDLLTMLRSHGYDLEVIDADSIVLPGPYPGQNRTNRRILQLHDVWHLVAGYGFTGPGEVAISGFQMAQFGQNYSTRFLATVATLAALHMGPLAEMMLTVMFDGWRHGRATPDLMTVPWHDKLGVPIPQLREELGIRPFESPIARMMEAAQPAVAA